MNSSLVRMCVLLASSAVSACSETPVEPASVNDIAVALSVSRSAFRSAEGTTVRITVTNNGRGIASISTPQCQSLFEVNRANTTIVAAGGFPCPAIHAPQTLRPGESATYERPWNGSDWNWAVQLRAGQYQLRGKVLMGQQAMVGQSVTVELLPQ